MFSLTYSEYIDIIRSGLKRETVFIKREPHECMINFYNPEILMLHGANMDIQIVLNMYGCATYMLNYVNKPNTGMSKLLSLADIRKGNPTLKEQLRMLGNRFLNASEFSAQEAVYYILGLPLSSCSRLCQFINTCSPDKRVVLKRQKDLEELPPDSTNIQRTGATITSQTRIAIERELARNPWFRTLKHHTADNRYPCLTSDGSANSLSLF